uniref:Uncharacterized protein n=1 Tax=Timema tahoe TaxID=61484 RepID=A0A7R9IQX1_9NEOP|nr:unnamed protein product [Timema tahoe]
MHTFGSWRGPTDFNLTICAHLLGSCGCHAGRRVGPVKGRIVTRPEKGQRLLVAATSGTLTSGCWRGPAGFARLAACCTCLPGLLPVEKALAAKPSTLGLVANHLPPGTSSFLPGGTFNPSEWKYSTPDKTGCTSLPLPADPPTLAANFSILGAGRFLGSGFLNASSGGLLSTPKIFPFFIFTVGSIAGLRLAHAQNAQNPGTRKRCRTTPCTPIPSKRGTTVINTLLTEGSENMNCGAVQAIERVVGVVFASSEERYNGCIINYARTRAIYFINENLRKEDKIHEDIVMDMEAEENVNQKIVLRMPCLEDIVMDMEGERNGDIVGLIEMY